MRGGSLVALLALLAAATCARAHGGAHGGLGHARLHLAHVATCRSARRTCTSTLAALARGGDVHVRAGTALNLFYPGPTDVGQPSRFESGVPVNVTFEWPCDDERSVTWLVRTGDGLRATATAVATDARCDAGTRPSGGAPPCPAAPANGDFEAGSDGVAWRDVSARFGRNIRSANGDSALTLSGAYGVYFGDGDAPAPPAPQLDYVEQTLVVSTRAVSLSFKYYASATQVFAGHTLFELSLDGAVLFALDPGAAPQLCEWTEVRLPLARATPLPAYNYADGLAHTLRLAFTQTDRGTFYVDDVRVECAPRALGTRPRATLAPACPCARTQLQCPGTPQQPAAQRECECAGVDGWGTDLENTASHADEAVLAPHNVGALAERCRLHVGGDTSGRAASHAGVAYFVSWDGANSEPLARPNTLWAMRISDCSVVWSHPVYPTYFNDATWEGARCEARERRQATSRTTPALDPDADRLFIGSSTARYACVRMSTGALVWRSDRVELAAGATITTSPRFYRGRVLGATSARQEFFTDGARLTFRGSATSLDAATGALDWRTYLISDERYAQGFRGVSAWGSAPAVDVKRDVVYVASGNNIAIPPNVSECINSTIRDPANPNNGFIDFEACKISGNWVDAFVAIRLDDGAIAWATSVLGADAWHDICPNPHPQPSTRAPPRRRVRSARTGIAGAARDVEASAPRLGDVLATPDERIVLSPQALAPLRAKIDELARARLGANAQTAAAAASNAARAGHVRVGAPPALQPFFAPTLAYTRDASAPGACEAVDACALGAGARRFVSLGAGLANVGAGDFVLGAPPGPGGAVAYDHLTCDAGAVDDDRVVASLFATAIDETFSVAWPGGGIATSACWSDDFSIGSPAPPNFPSCASQGVTSGYARVFDASGLLTPRTTPCAALDVTDMAPGTYALVHAFDPFNAFSTLAAGPPFVWGPGPAVNFFRGVRLVPALNIVEEVPFLLALPESVQLEQRLVSASSCGVAGCAGPAPVLGVRKLLHASVSILNGDGFSIQGVPLAVGAPTDHDTLAFETASCGEGAPKRRLANALLLELLALDAVTVVASRRLGLCFEDAANGFTCGGTQGMGANAQLFVSTREQCNTLDVTDVPAGDYLLRATLDPDATLRATVPAFVPAPEAFGLLLPVTLPDRFPTAPCDFAVGPDWDFGQAPILVEREVDERACRLTCTDDDDDDDADDDYSHGHDDGTRRCDPVVCARKLAIAGQKSGVVWALDRATGSVVWKRKVAPGGSLGGLQWGSASDGAHFFYASSDTDGLPSELTSYDGVNTTIYGGSWGALSVADGSVLWQTADPDWAGGHQLGPVSYANGVLYGGSYSGRLHALSAATGAILKSLNVEAEDNFAPLVERGVVFTGAGYRRSTTHTVLVYDTCASQCHYDAGAQSCVGTCASARDTCVRSKRGAPTCECKR